MSDKKGAKKEPGIQKHDTEAAHLYEGYNPVPKKVVSTKGFNPVPNGDVVRPSNKPHIPPPQNKENKKQD